jgi:hypothetical protein
MIAQGHERADLVSYATRCGIQPEAMVAQIETLLDRYDEANWPAVHVRQDYFILLMHHPHAYAAARATAYLGDLTPLTHRLTTATVPPTLYYAPHASVHADTTEAIETEIFCAYRSFHFRGVVVHQNGHPLGDFGVAGGAHQVALVVGHVCRPSGGQGPDIPDPSMSPDLRVAISFSPAATVTVRNREYTFGYKAHLLSADGDYIMFVVHRTGQLGRVPAMLPNGAVDFRMMLPPIFEPLLRILVYAFRATSRARHPTREAVPILATMHDTFVNMATCVGIADQIEARALENATPVRLQADAVYAFAPLDLRVLAQPMAQTAREAGPAEARAYTTACQVIVWVYRHLRTYDSLPIITHAPLQRADGTFRSFNSTLWKCKAPMEVFLVCMAWYDRISFNLNSPVPHMRNVPYR